MPRAAQPETDEFMSARIELGNRVRAARQAQGKSLETLAEGSALHWSFVSRVERGHGNLTLKSLLRLADALGIDPGDLVAGLALDSHQD
ncbi:MAG: hypothetical protein NVSMB48_09160 [Marmoricola sp.]